MSTNQVSPFAADKGRVIVSDLDGPDYGSNKRPSVAYVGGLDTDREGQELRRRRKRSYEPGTEEYASYVEKRVFNKRHAWTPYLWQRKRDKQLMGNLNPTKGWKGWKHRQKMRWNSIKLTFKEWNDALEVWRHSLKLIEGRQGTGAVSYFVFLKFLLFLNIFIFLATFICVVFFQAAFDVTDFTKETTGYDNSNDHPGVELSNNCSGLYTVNETYGFQLVLDFIQGTGWMETTAFFYGHYSNQEVSIPGDTYNMPLAYLLTTILVLVVSLVVMVHHTFSNYSETLVSSGFGNGNAFFRICFCSWDYRLYQEMPISLQYKNFYHLLGAELEELRHAEKKRNSTRGQRCMLWTLRIFVNTCIIALLVASATAIYFAQTFSTEFTRSESAKDYHMIVVLLVEYLPSIIIGIVNAVYPLLFGLIVIAERYMPSFVIKITVLRVVFVRLCALIVITLTIYQEISCSPKDACNVGTGGSCPKIQCWETYFGQQIYKLMVSEFAVELILTIGYELPRKLVTTKCNFALAKKLGPAEFDIPILVLDLVYAQSLCWLGFYFAPLLPVYLTIRLVALFYLKKLSALYTTIPPERPYHAARSNAFYMVTLLIAFFLTAIPVGYVLVQLKPSPMCGPFRIYEFPTEIVSIQIDVADPWFRTLWLISTSSAFITAIVIILALALYYCSAMRSANMKMIKTLKTQVLQDEKDKQYLLVQLSKYTEGKEMDKPAPTKPFALPGRENKPQPNMQTTAKPASNGRTHNTSNGTSHQQVNTISETGARDSVTTEGNTAQIPISARQYNNYL